MGYCESFFANRFDHSVHRDRIRGMLKGSRPKLTFRIATTELRFWDPQGYVRS